MRNASLFNIKERRKINSVHSFINEDIPIFGAANII